MACHRVASEPLGRLRIVLLGAFAGLLLTGGIPRVCVVASAQPAPAPRQEPPGPPPAGQVPADRLGADIPSSEGGPERHPGSGAPGGVVRPPAGVDPGMPTAPAVPAPHPGTTPVIPPPGAPGGDPRVQPR